MLSDTSPIGYTYGEAKSVLEGLNFVCAAHGGTSHRHWKCKLQNGTALHVGLVEHPSKPLKPVYIRDMLKELKRGGLA